MKGLFAIKLNNQTWLETIELLIKKNDFGFK